MSNLHPSLPTLPPPPAPGAPAEHRALPPQHPPHTAMERPGATALRGPAPAPTPLYALPALPALPAAGGYGGGGMPPASGGGAGGAPLTSGRGNGLDYAVMRKEKAREEYKEKRRLELLASGEVERTKRRKKNDTTMSENQKYHRRLKMNQDSAAAARHAQEVYVETLEKLVETTEAEKSILSIQALNLRSERDELVRRVELLQHQLANVDGGAEPHAAGKTQTHVDLKAVIELIDAGAHGAPQEYRSAAVYPSPAM